ncbi:MAG: DUF4965 domain-containing protein [Phycisphaeraceae bacterium]
MTWTMARLGSRFSLMFEPYRRCVMHSAMGRLLDEPVDLMVGLVEPDGTERVLPFTTRGTPLYNCEQFDRINSITYRGYSEKYRLRFEFNVHSVFYPQNEQLCMMPAFYLEMRVNPVDRVRWIKPQGEQPDKVKMFIRLTRPGTSISASAGEAAGGSASVPGPTGPRLDLSYTGRLSAATEHPKDPVAGDGALRSVTVRERIVSLNPDARPDADGQGLTLELPVSEEGSGIKWRLVWGAHVAEPMLELTNPKRNGGKPTLGKFRYVQYWRDLDALMTEAVTGRDDLLAHSRRMEKVFDQMPLNGAQRHLLHQSYQAYLNNTFWCDLADGSEWFSVWEGTCLFHSTIDVEYNVCLFYLTLWPRLLALQLDQWPLVEKPHPASGGGILSHDIGVGVHTGKQAYPHDMPVEENSNYLLMLQAYAHWTGDASLIKPHADLIERLVKYLIWTDRDDSGFPSEGVANTIDDASPATQYARRQTYLAIKRVAALHAAADLLERADRSELAQKCVGVAGTAAASIQRLAWLGDHFAVCIDQTTEDMVDVWSGKPLPYRELTGWDGYSIYTANGLLLPLLIDRPCPLDVEKLRADLTNATREAQGRYGCGHTSFEVDNVWVSQNLWRDHLGRYLDARLPMMAHHYWDLQVMSNTHDQSHGFIDTYVNNNLAFYPRGITCLGWALAEPRLVIDRLAAGGERITVEPDTHWPQRWPLLALADWKAGKVPVCVVDAKGNVTIEGQIDPVVIRSGKPEGAGLIG